MTLNKSLPEGWKWEKISDVANTQSGSGFPKELQGCDSGDYPFAKVSDISEAVKTDSGYIKKANNYLSAAKAKKIGAKVYPAGTTLFAKIGEAVRLNRRVLCTRDFLADNNVMGLIPNIEKVMPKFLFLYTHTIDLYEYSQATTVPSVRTTDIQQIDIPLPPLPDQERIVEKIETLFSQLDAGVTALKRTQAALKRYRASVLKAAFEGKLVPQNPADEPAEAALRRMGKAPQSGDDLPQLPEGWCWATVGEAALVHNKRVSPLNFPDLPYIGMENVEAHTMKLLGTVQAKDMKSLAETFDPGDVLYGRLRPYLNKVYCPEFIGLCSTEFIIFRKVSHINSKYMQYFLNSLDFVKFANSLNSGDRPRVKFEQLAIYPFPLAPFPEQVRIAEEIERRLSVVLQVEQSIKSSLIRVERLRQAVLKQAFEGKLLSTEITNLSTPSD